MNKYCNELVQKIKTIQKAKGLNIKDVTFDIKKINVFFGIDMFTTIASWYLDWEPDDLEIAYIRNQLLKSASKFAKIFKNIKRIK